jgi:CheY-like chemotaxis protein
MADPLGILIVDDDAGMADTMGDILEAKGYRVKIASDGPKALACLQAEPFDVVFLDIKMPEMDGVEVLQRMKHMCPGTPAVMMTAYAVPDLIAQAEREGALTVLTKPLPLDRVLKFLDELAPARPVLIVEDDATFRNSLQDIIEAHGYSVVSAVDAPSAVEVARRSRPDVVLLDLKLPVADGYEVLREIRLLDPTTRILLMTGYGQELQALVEKSLQAGALLCLYKPFDPADVLRHVSSLRSQRAAGQLLGPDADADRDHPGS